jgi:hypothetical protein
LDLRALSPTIASSVAFLSLFSFLPALMGFTAAGAQPTERTVTRLEINEEVIMRVPVRPAPVPPRYRWVTTKGPKCVPVAAVRGALLSGTEFVDFTVPNRMKRVRAEFGAGCPALDFYGGFYLRPDDDGRLCARRDSIYSRIGGSCRIERFKLLTATPRR